jgi:hypothetical protein
MVFVQVCIITLGLPPTDREEEGSVVLRWLTREERRGLRAGTFWFLVESRWWRDWYEYVHCQYLPLVGGGAAASIAHQNEGSSSLPVGTSSASIASSSSSPAGSRYGSLKRGSVGKRLTSSTLASDSDSGVIMTSCQQIYSDEQSPVNSISILSPGRLTR